MGMNPASSVQRQSVIEMRFLGGMGIAVPPDLHAYTDPSEKGYVNGEIFLIWHTSTPGQRFAAAESLRVNDVHALLHADPLSARPGPLSTSR